MSQNTGPLWTEEASAKARSPSARIAFTSCVVQAPLVMGARIGGWSSSCRAPSPQRESGERPPSTTRGVPLKWAVAMPLTALVTPGPAVTAAKPGVRVSRPVASAANTAVCSCLVSTRRSRPPRSASMRSAAASTRSLPPTAASYTGKMCAPEREKTVETPAAQAASMMCSPP